MALKDYQETITLSMLYKVTKRGQVQGSEQLIPNLFINSGTVDVYGSNSATQPVNLAAMTLNTENTGVSGVNGFSIIPTYIAIVQNGGTTTEIIASGLDITMIGSIS